MCIRDRPIREQRAAERLRDGAMRLIRVIAPQIRIRRKVNLAIGQRFRIAVAMKIRPAFLVAPDHLLDQRIRQKRMRKMRADQMIAPQQLVQRLHGDEVKRIRFLFLPARRIDSSRRLVFPGGEHAVHPKPVAQADAQRLVPSPCIAMELCTQHCLRRKAQA